MRGFLKTCFLCSYVGWVVFRGAMRFWGKRVLVLFKAMERCLLHSWVISFRRHVRVIVKVLLFMLIKTTPALFYNYEYNTCKSILLARCCEASMRSHYWSPPNQNRNQFKLTLIVEIMTQYYIEDLDVFCKFSSKMSTSETFSGGTGCTPVSPRAIATMLGVTPSSNSLRKMIIVC